MTVKYEVSAVTGKYTDKDGNEKSRYVKLGVILETRNGLMLKAEALPIGWDGWAYLNEPREREESNKPRPNRSAPASPALDDDLPPF